MHRIFFAHREIENWRSDFDGLKVFSRLSHAKGRPRAALKTIEDADGWRLGAKS
jgi:hypothetical protein